MKIEINWVDKEYEIQKEDGSTDTITKSTPIPKVFLEGEEKGEEMITVGQLYLAAECVKSCKAEDYTVLSSETKDPEGNVEKIQPSILLEIDDATMTAKIKSTMKKAELWAYFTGTAEGTMAEDVSRMVIFGLMPIRAQFYNSEVIPKLSQTIIRGIIGALSGKVPLNKSHGGLIIPK